MRVKTFSALFALLGLTLVFSLPARAQVKTEPAADGSTEVRAQGRKAPAGVAGGYEKESAKPKGLKIRY